MSPKSYSHNSIRIAGRIPIQFLVLGAVLTMIAVVYLQTAFFAFAYDDFGQIVYNPGIQSWGRALKFFTSQVWAQSGGISYYYRPVFMLWLRMNQALFGPHPFYWHLGAIALHLLSCLLLYFFLYRITVDRWTSTVSVLLFGLHPVHIEAVAWISGATETLMASLLLGSLLCFQKQRDSRNGKARLRMASLLLATLAVLTKETAIVLPAVIFSYEWILGNVAGYRARFLSAARASMPYVIISCGFVVLRSLALNHITPPRTAASVISVLLAWPEIVMFYGVHALLPLRLSAFYKLVLVTRPGLWNFLLPVFLLLAPAMVLIYGSRRSRVFAFFGMWYAILLVPMLGLTLSYNVENVHDRYLYLPSIAMCVLVAALLTRLREMRRTVTTLLVLAIISCGYILVTIRESRYWMNDSALGEHSLAVSPGNPLAAQLLANAYIRDDRISEAIPYLLDSLDAQPGNADTLRSLGLCYLEINALPLAEEYLTKSIMRNGSRPESHLFLGEVRLKQNRLEEAEAEIRQGLQLQSQFTPGGGLLFHYYLGNILFAKGDAQGAMREYRLEVRNDPALDPGVVEAQARLDQIARQFPAQQP